MQKPCPRCRKRTNRASIWTLLLAFALLAVLPCAQAGQIRPSETPADASVRRVQTLLTRKGVGKDELRKLEAELEQARNTRPEGPAGAKAGFFLARVQEELARKSGLKSDWSKAAESFGAYLERFPRQQLAPEALYRRGLIRLQHLSDPGGALADFQTLARGHASSPRVALARVLARTALKASQTLSSSAKKNASAPEPSSANLSAPIDVGKPELVGIRHKSSPRYARVVLDVDAHVRYKSQLLEQAKSGARRIDIDLMGAHMGPGVKEDVQVSGGMLKSIRAVQKDQNTTRVALDFSDLKDYKITVLEAPYRLILDAVGTQEAIASPSAAADGQPEPPRPAMNFAAPKGNRKRLAADLVEQLGLSVRTIVVDAGHGGMDPGARGFGLQEKDVTLRMALILGKMLEEHGFRVIYTRTTDVFLALGERTALANSQKADLFVSVHCNANTNPAINGLETYSLNLARTPDAVRVAERENAVSDKNISDLQMILTDLMLTSKIKESVDLARGVHRQGLSAIRGKWDVVDHGNREAPFFVLMGAKMPAILIEMGYITNKTEAARLKTDAYLKILARGIADGIRDYKRQIEDHTAK